MNDKNKKIVTILSIFTIIFTLMGGTLAYWTWTSDVRTGVAFTIAKDFSCSADGGQDLTSTNVALQPTSDCTNSEVALQRTIKVTPDIRRDGLTISLNMWLKVNNIDPELAASDNLMYAISTVEGSCKKGMNGYVNSGNFKDLTTGDKANLVSGKSYTGTNLGQDTYYLYIWLDAAETNSNTMDKSFDLSLEGECTDAPGPEAPVLDDGMIPVTIANDGTVTVVSEDDPNWYNYENKQWANVVLVEEEGGGADDSLTREYYQNPENIGEKVTPEDILAYYVWIPRYKYRIPTNTTCEDIENPSIETHSDCYGAPYTLKITREEAKEYMINYYSEWLSGECAEEICTEEEVEEYIDFADLDIALDNLLAGEIIFEWINYQGFILKDILPASTYDSSFLPDNMITGGPTTIDIEFETKEESRVLGNATSQYRTHPAFWWDHDSDAYLDSGELIPGFWTGKFFATKDKTNDCDPVASYNKSNTCNDELNLNPTILPSEIALLSQNEEGKFNTSRNMSKEGNIYGLDHESINAHAIKNSDWGAIAYLSHSEYGINGEIRYNNNDIYPDRHDGFYHYYSSSLAGCGALTKNGKSTTDCENEFGTVETYPQSTTGNISGVFDMHTSNDTMVMGLIGGVLGDMVIDGGCVGKYPELKYYDLYSVDIFKQPEPGYNQYYCTLDTCGGQALHETANWYKNGINYVYFPDYSHGEMFTRSDLFHSSQNEYSCEFSYGFYFRSVLVPGFGD